MNEYVTIDGIEYPATTIQQVYRLLETLNTRLAPEDLELLRTVLDNGLANELLRDVLSGAVILEEPA